MQASEGAFEAYEMLHKELELVVRERDMARTQVCWVDTVSIRVSVCTLDRWTKEAMYKSTSWRRNQVT